MNKDIRENVDNFYYICLFCSSTNCYLDDIVLNLFWECDCFEETSFIDIMDYVAS